MNHRIITILTIFLLFARHGYCVDEDPETKDLFTISGTLKDATTGEALIGATIYIKETQGGNITNVYGFYSISLPAGNYHLVYAYLGYNSVEKEISHFQNQVINLELSPASESIDEIVVTSQRKDANVREPQMGVEKLQSKTIKNVPVLMGETDLVKVIQLLPGVSPTSEGSSGFSVRGGNPDQNLILLDEASVYNAGHLMGFFSVFNNDAVKDVKLYKGDIPASNGGRLSSLLDIRMKDGNSKKFTGTGGIGTISSRLTLEGPIVQDKTSFIVSGRRTYVDLFLPLSSNEAIRDNRLYFYDFNAKVNHTINENNRIYLSGYFGRDVFKNDFSKMDFGNKTVTARWNHIFSPKLFSNFTLIGSQYDYALGTVDSGADSFEWESSLYDLSAKVDFDYYINPENTVEFGAQSIFREILPGLARGTDENSLYNEIKVPENRSLEHALYVQNTQKISDWLVLKYGLRWSIFQNIGAGTQYYYDENHEFINSEHFKTGEVYNTYNGIEPRLGASFILNPTSSIKASYNRTYQYLHLASNSSSGTPLDVWFPSSPNVKPQKADQFSIGYFRNFSDNTIETSIEGFYKKMDNSIDFKDHPDLLLNEYLEGELRFGDAEAYGMEFMLRFNRPKWNGWISYTLSRVERTIPEINDGKPYLSPYDHTHDCSIVLNRNLSERTSLSANWVFYTGSPATYPVGRYKVGGDIIPLYSERNSERMPDYHRLDLSLILSGKHKENRKWQGEWVFSVYNAYGRKNAWAINFVRDDDDPSITKAQKTYLFSIIPSVTYNFKF
nr:TonB-dependent receptor [uncultured Carboxylicivirga sp.]